MSLSRSLHSVHETPPVGASPAEGVSVQFGILGPLQVRAGDNVLEVRRGRPRTLLTALVLRAGETVSAGTLMELLWGDEPPRNPANALQIQVSYLRKVLAPCGGARVLVTRPGGYALDVAPEQVDATRFERMVRQASRLAVQGGLAGASARVDTLDAALALWRGEALSDVAGEEFALGDIARLDELRWAAVEGRNDLLLSLGRHHEVLAELGRLVFAHPLRERFHEQLMLALYRSGRQADALRAYEQARDILVNELGVDPGPGLQRLERQVLAQDRALEWSPPQGEEAVATAPSTMSSLPGLAAPALPIPVTDLVGREAETARVRDLLRRSRVVTLTGPGGTGKSRLALEVARAESADIQVWYVDLGTAASPELVPLTVAAALGVATSPEEDAREAVSLALSLQDGLLLLDTCEHVIVGAAELVARVLARGAEVRVLATSRTPLRLTAEMAWPVPPLALSPPGARTAEEVASFPAVRLFLERASGKRLGFTLTDDNAGDVAAICHGLDGLPLAIELAAARADVLTPAAIRARLENRFEFLVDGGRDLAARQQTLRSAIDWSFDLLEDDQRRFFARLAVFAGSFGLDAAISVAGDGFRDPLGLLASLVRQSMVVVVGDDRYRLLDTLRAYAAGLVEGPPGPAAEDAVAIRRRHAEYYATRAEVADSRIRGPGQAASLSDLRTDLPNFRTALQWSLGCGQGQLAARLTGALAWFWTLSGMLDEAVQYHDRAMAVPDLPVLVRAKVLWGGGLLAASLGHLERARALGAESVRLAREAGDAAAIGAALNTLAVAQWALGECEAAVVSHAEAIRHFGVAGHDWGRAVCTVLRTRTALDTGEPGADRMAREALALARACGDQHVVGIALEQIARAELASGRPDAAAAAAAEALAAQESIGYTEGTIAALHLLGASRLASGRHAEARELHLRALALASRIGHAAAVCEAVEELARIAVAERSSEEALRLLRACREERRRRNLPRRPPDQRALDELACSAPGQGGLDQLTATPAPAPGPLAQLVKELLASGPAPADGARVLGTDGPFGGERWSSR